MKKIPTLFKKVYNPDGRYMLSKEVTPGMEMILDGYGLATVKWDGTPVLYLDGLGWHKRFDYKPGRKLPEDAIPCTAQRDEITGHWHHWVPIIWSDPANKCICKAITNYIRYGSAQIVSGTTFEAIGPGINGNPYGLAQGTLKVHGAMIVSDFPRDFQRAGAWLRDHVVEGIVFWLNGEPVCKLRRVDYGYCWPLNRIALGGVDRD